MRAVRARRERSPRAALRTLAIVAAVAVVCALALAIGYLAWSSPPGVDPAAVEVQVIP
jgi:fatty acid desaturase